MNRSRDDMLSDVVATLIDNIATRYPTHVSSPVLGPVIKAYGDAYEDRRMQAPSFAVAAHEAKAHAIRMVLDLTDAELYRATLFRHPLRPRALALELHGDQLDQAGQPYIGHLDDVAGDPEHASDANLAVRYLHDTLEDCLIEDPGTGVRRKLTREDLLDRGVYPDDVDAIELLTKPGGKLPRLEGESTSDWKVRDYLSKVARIETADLPAEVRLRAAMTKLRDNLSNLSERRAARLTPERHAYWRTVLVPRYQASVLLLNGMIGRLMAEVLMPPEASTEEGPAIQAHRIHRER